MAGTFGNQALPGVYVRLVSSRQNGLNENLSGVVVMPLINHGYGPEKEFIDISSGSPDAAMVKLGYSVYDNDPNMIMLREAFKAASRVIVYIPKQGEKAKVTSGTLTAAAKYGGSRGNALGFAIVANPVGGFDVTIMLDGSVVELFEGVETISELASAWIDFSGEGELVAVAGATLTGGADGVATNADITAFLDATEDVAWNVLLFPVEPTGETGDNTQALHAALMAKISYLRDDAGRRNRYAVAVDFKADYEGIINVTNSVKLSDGSELTKGQAAAWVAGATAAAGYTETLTYRPYPGAVGVVGAKKGQSAVDAAKAGEFFFIVLEGNEVVAQYDINSLTTFAPPKDSQFRKNKIMRVFDSFIMDIQQMFRPGSLRNDPVGWSVMESMGNGLLQTYEANGGIQQVDYANDFKVDRSMSIGDSVYFNIGLMAVDNAEKLYFTINVR